MAVNTKYRTQETEIMDDFSLKGEELREALDQIARINQLLGGNKIILQGIKRLLNQSHTNKTITVADIGCGNGDMLRTLSKFGKKNKLNFQLTGIDANEFTVNYAKKLSQEYPNIEYKCVDIFSDDFKTMKFDIILCTLTLHHFTNEQILKIISIFNNNAETGFIINDLHRSKTAYRLFEMICFIFNLNSMSREDGLISILRGFRKKELEEFSKKLNFKNYTINWKWAFRYQWIIAKK
jgi:2-polyprenyl-3-methyl-5-hydroxy-6-metoxy-1,4-benzoquinol methylase